MSKRTPLIETRSSKVKNCTICWIFLSILSLLLLKLFFKGWPTYYTPHLSECTTLKDLKIIKTKINLSSTSSCPLIDKLNMIDLGLLSPETKSVEVSLVSRRTTQGVNHSNGFQIKISGYIEGRGFHSNELWRSISFQNTVNILYLTEKDHCEEADIVQFSPNKRGNYKVHLTIIESHDSMKINENYVMNATLSKFNISYWSFVSVQKIAIFVISFLTLVIFYCKLEKTETSYEHLFIYQLLLAIMLSNQPFTSLSLKISETFQIVALALDAALYASLLHFWLISLRTIVSSVKFKEDSSNPGLSGSMTAKIISILYFIANIVADYKDYHSYSNNEFPHELNLQGTLFYIKSSILLIGVIFTLFNIVRIHIIWKNLSAKHQNFVSVSYFFIFTVVALMCFKLRALSQYPIRIVISKIIPLLYVALLVFFYSSTIEEEDVEEFRPEEDTQIKQGLPVQISQNKYLKEETEEDEKEKYENENEYAYEMEGFDSYIEKQNSYKYDNQNQQDEFDDDTGNVSYDKDYDHEDDNDYEDGDEEEYEDEIETKNENKLVSFNESM